MNALSLTHTYRIRPDIFIKSSTDRVHISYQSRHFILKMGASMVASLLEFLDKNDGSRSLNESLTGYAEQQQNAFIKFLDFLLQKGAVIKQSQDTQTTHDLSAVTDTITYLAEYQNDPVQSYLKFASQKLLIAGDGYALLSATKTLARMGVKALSIAILPQCGRFHFSNEDLRKAFIQHQRWNDAELEFISVRDNTLSGHYDNALVCSEIAINPKTTSLPLVHATNIQYGTLNARHAFLSCDPITSASLASDAQETSATLIAHLMAGANIAVAWCDHLMGVREQKQGSYQYYDLHQQSWTKTASEHRLTSIFEQANTTGIASKTILSGQLDQLSSEPLFPISCFEELTDTNSYIKLYRAALRLEDEVQPIRKIITAGFSRKQCQHAMLIETATLHQVWLEQGETQERSNFKHAASLTDHARKLIADRASLVTQAIANATPAIASNKSEEYLFFCIETSFGTRVHTQSLVTDDTQWPYCLVASADEETVFLLFADTPSDADREALWFGLYAALWIRHNNERSHVNRIFIPQVALPAPSEVGNE